MKRLSLTIFLLLSAFAVPAQPRNDAVELLRHALEAAPRLRYSGTRIVTVKLGVDRRVHTELIEKDGDRTRVEFPTGEPNAGQVVVETASERRHYFPQRNEIRVQAPRREVAFKNLIKLSSGVGMRRRLQVADGGFVAGQRVSMLTVLDPRGNPVQRLWIEPRSGAILKRELYDRTGALQGGFAFTQVNLSPRVDERDFQLQVKGAKVSSPRSELRQMAKRLQLAEVWLPGESGYQLDSVRIQSFGAQQVLVQQYLNQEHRFSLFELRGVIDPARLQQSARGLQSVTWTKNGTTFALVGDIPATELEELARQLGR